MLVFPTYGDAYTAGQVFFLPPDKLPWPKLFILQIVKGGSRSRKIVLEFYHIASGKLTKSYWTWSIEIVDLPSYKMLIFHSFFVRLPEGSHSKS